VCFGMVRWNKRDFERRTKMIKGMQKDLEYTYRKLRALKGKVEEVTGVPPEVVQATLAEMDRAQAAFLGELQEIEAHQTSDSKGEHSGETETEQPQKSEAPQAHQEEGVEDEEQTVSDQKENDEALPAVANE